MAEVSGGPGNTPLVESDSPFQTREAPDTDSIDGIDSAPGGAFFFWRPRPVEDGERRRIKTVSATLADPSEANISHLKENPDEYENA